MNLYEQRSTWKMLLLAAAFLIVVASLFYTNVLANNIAEEEKAKVELWANAYHNLNLADENTDVSFLFEVIKNNETVPVILTDDNDLIKASRNFDQDRVDSDPGYLIEQLAEMKLEREPIIIATSGGKNNYIYYKDSTPLVQLRYFPYVQIGIIGIFFFIAYVAFSSARTAEQNRVWAGMAKETAHQLGTPISSLAAWVQYLKEVNVNEPVSPEILVELEKDIDRLELVAERFSKIGSTPKLEQANINSHLLKIMDYLQHRSSDQVSYTMVNKDELMAPINAPLFEWVVENLLKNALDAMDGKGSISINSGVKEDSIWIEITDNGKGIPSSKFSTVFEPGYSTKKRGWGLGLALTKRIVEQYHKGKIVVLRSEIGKGTTFGITLPS